MRHHTRLVVVLGVLTATTAILWASLASAMTFSSSQYLIDSAVLNNVGGDSSSTSYQLTSSGGESAIGNGAGGSYKMPAGFVAQLPTMLSLTVQPAGLVGYYPFDEVGS